MSVNDGVLRSVPSDSDVDDGRLYDPTATDAGGTNYTLAIEAGSFLLNAQGVGLLVGRRVASDVGSFSLTGEPVLFSISRRMPASAGSFSLTGEPIGLLSGRKLTASPEIFSLMGQNAGVYVGRTVSVGAGTFTFTGEPVTLTVVEITTGDDIERVPVSVYLALSPYPFVVSIRSDRHEIMAKTTPTAVGVGLDK